MKKEMILDLVRQRAEFVLKPSTLNGLNIDVQQYALDEVLINFEKQVYAERKDSSVDVVFKYSVPDGWFQMWKNEVAPKWFLKKWPVKFKEYTIEKTQWVEWVIPKEEYQSFGDGMQRISIPNTYVKAVR